MCQNDDPDIGFQVRTETCNAARARARAEKSRAAKKKDEPGVILGTDPFTYSRTPLDDFRDPFYREKQKERAEEEKARPIRERDEPLEPAH